MPIGVDGGIVVTVEDAETVSSKLAVGEPTEFTGCTQLLKIAGRITVRHPRGTLTGTLWSAGCLGGPALPCQSCGAWRSLDSVGIARRGWRAESD
jgi:hypothetical protein